MKTQTLFRRDKYKRFCLALILGTLCCGVGVRAEFPRFLSAVKGGGELSALGVGVDAFTNAYVLGAFGTTTTIGGILVTNLTGSQNIFVAKYRYGGSPASSPTFLWALNSVSDSPLSDARITGFSTGPFVLGSFAGTNLTFGNFTITNFASGSDDVFLVKYFQAGSVSWLKQMGGT